MVEPGNIRQVVWVNGPSFWIDGEKHCTFESVMNSQNFCHHRQGFFGAVLLVATDENNVLAFTGPLRYLRIQPKVLRLSCHSPFVL